MLAAHHSDAAVAAAASTLLLVRAASGGFLRFVAFLSFRKRKPSNDTASCPVTAEGVIALGGLLFVRATFIVLRDPLAKEPAVHAALKQALRSMQPLPAGLSVSAKAAAIVRAALARPQVGCLSVRNTDRAV